MAEELIDMSEADWLAEGRRRFGWDMMQWKFVCPICKHVQTVLDFKPYAGCRTDAQRASVLAPLSKGMRDVVVIVARRLTEVKR
jgi:hypothetical protein